MLEDIIKYVQLVGEFKPVVREVLDSLKQYEEEYNEITSFYVKNIVKNKTAIYKGFIDEGITLDHALALTINSTAEISKSFEKASQRKSK